MRTSLKSYIILRSFENCVEIKSITMYDSCLVHSMLEKEINLLKFIQSATFKVKNKPIRVFAKTTLDLIQLKLTSSSGHKCRSKVEKIFLVKITLSNSLSLDHKNFYCPKKCIYSFVLNAQFHLGMELCKNEQLMETFYLLI